MRPCATVVGVLLVTIGQLQSRSPYYLSGVGPPILRFDTPERGQIVPTEFSFNESKPPVPAKTDVPAPAGMSSASTNTAIASASGPGKNSAETNLTDSVAQPFIPLIENGQTSEVDPNIVTPLMVLEYLQPMGGLSNTNGKGAAVLIPVKINFTPPVRVNNSSTAVYQRE